MMYTCKIIMYTYIDHNVYMQDIYVYMQDDYVNMCTLLRMHAR